ncbi:hypothetical protein SCA6_007203 [Theobroma cacao]
MGCFPCFDSSEEEKLTPVKETDDRKQGQPTVSSNISRLSSGGDRLRSRSNGGSKRELPSPRDGPGVQIAAQIFTFRELAAATKNFRPESFLGEGGFGRVYKGRLESTGQVVAVKQLDRNGLQGNREFLVEWSQCCCEECKACCLLQDKEIVELIGILHELKATLWLGYLTWKLKLKLYCIRLRLITVYMQDHVLHCNCYAKQIQHFQPKLSFE